jgi:CBS domain-containing protein
VNIAQIMTPLVVTVRAHTPLRDVAVLLTENRIAGVPVCTDDGQVVGVVSEADIVRTETGTPSAGGRQPAPSPDDVAQERPDAGTAGAAMSAPAITIAPGAQVAEAARVMIERGVNRLPVLNNGTLVGIVARSDLVRAFVRSDHEIAREITEDIIVGLLWLDPDATTLTVELGNVTIEGQVDRASVAEMIEALIRRVPGVVAVTSRLTWETDEATPRRRERSTRRTPQLP